jgi:hypothetical protein
MDTLITCSPPPSATPFTGGTSEQSRPGQWSGGAMQCDTLLLLG